MFVELHLLQNFAPSNLNRDDTGAPKDCQFGGRRRARISSQSLKRAIRTYVREQGLLPREYLATRSRRFVGKLVEKLMGRGKPEAESYQVVEAALGSAKLTVEDGLTQYLLFLGEAEVDRLADLCAEHWDVLLAASPAAQNSDGTKRGAKKAALEAVPEALGAALQSVLDGGRAADLAMYGRMLADLPKARIDAASQVAHALSTHEVNVEFDYYTAVDELNTEDTSGAGMLGTVEFNSACYYRYSNVHVWQLLKNLEPGRELALQSLEAFLRASVLAVPAGKQTSMAAHNPPSLVLAVVRTSGLWSLANAFEHPVRPNAQEGIVEQSIRALDRYFSELQAVYGEYAGIAGTFVCTLHSGCLDGLRNAYVPTVPELVQRVMTVVTSGIGESQGVAS